MKLKTGFVALFVICVMLFSTCAFLIEILDIILDDSNSGNKNTGTIISDDSSIDHQDDVYLTQETVREDETPQETEGTGIIFIPNDDEIASLLAEAQNPRAIVEPLLKTKWGQGVPYRNMLPVGHRSFCNLVAGAQVMKYHNHPVRGSGQSEAYTMINGAQVPALNFNVAYDWDNMLYTYRSDGRDSTEQQRNAVATLIYHAGVGRGRDFINGSVKNVWPVVFTTFFGYDKSVQTHERLFFTDAEWELIIKSQLDAGLPVMINGLNQDRSSNHYFIVDGYDNTGRYHINWGWSGRHDGWYPINALNTGSRDWNYWQTMIVNIKPDAGGAPYGYEMGLTEFSVAKTAVSQNELFTVTARIKNLASLDNFTGGQLGAALVDNNGRIVEVIGSRSRAALNARGTASAAEIVCFIPETVRPGQYRVMTVIKPEDGNWKVITRSAIGNGIPNSINITVSQAERGAPTGGYGIALEEFTPSLVSIPQNELFTITARTRNRGQETFNGGQLGAALVANNGNIVSVIGIVTYNSLNSGSSRTSTINCFVPETVRAGQYRLRIVTRPSDGEWRVNSLAIPDVSTAINFTVSQAERGAPTGGYGIVLEEFSLSNVSIPHNELFPVRVVTRNRGQESFAGGQLGAVLVDNNGNIVSVIGMVNYNTLNSGSTRTSTINCFVPETVRAGQYRLRIVTRPTDGDWRINTLAISGVSNAVNITINSVSGAMGGGYGMGLTAFTTDRTTSPRNEQFTVTYTIRNFGQEVFSGGQAGVALIDSNGNIVEVIGMGNTGVRNPGGTTSSIERNCTVPNTVAHGQYKLRVVIRPTGGEWRIASLSLPDVPNSIEFTVR